MECYGAIFTTAVTWETLIPIGRAGERFCCGTVAIGADPYDKPKHIPLVYRLVHSRLATPMLRFLARLPTEDSLHITDTSLLHLLQRLPARLVAWFAKKLFAPAQAKVPTEYVSLYATPRVELAP